MNNQAYEKSISIVEIEITTNGFAYKPLKEIAKLDNIGFVFWKKKEKEAIVSTKIDKYIDI